MSTALNNGNFPKGLFRLQKNIEKNYEEKIYLPCTITNINVTHKIENSNEMKNVSKLQTQIWDVDRIAKEFMTIKVE